MTAPDIFLSYNREDAAIARLYADAFARAGLEVWWDATLRSGEAYDEVTEAALNGAKAVVVLWSPRSVSSRWVRAEATVADQNKTLMPVTIEACRRPVMFELTQTAELSHWRGEANEPAWLGFLSDVRRKVGAKVEPPSVPSHVAQGNPVSVHSTLATLAVLPFVTRSGQSEDDDFAEGMVEDLTAALSGGGRFMTVVAASATAALRGGARDLRQIGRDLNVLFLLEGNVRRMGGNLRLTVQLVEAETGKILWLQKFDRELGDLFALQDELVAEVAAQLRLQVERAEMVNALKNHGGMTAEEAVLRALQYGSSGTRSGWEAAVAVCRKGVEFNPGSGLILASLASFQAFVLHHSGGDDPELKKEILGNIERARTLDGSGRTVLESTATALMWLRRPQEALPFAERAVAKGPGIAASRQILGMVLAMLGRSDEAIAEFDAIERLFPDSSYANYVLRWRSVAHLKAGRLEPALKAADQALRVLPGIDSLIQSILCHASLGDPDKARSSLRRLRELDPEMSHALAESLVRDVYHGSGTADKYVAMIRKVWDEAQNEGGA